MNYDVVWLKIAVFIHLFAACFYVLLTGIIYVASGHLVPFKVILSFMAVISFSTLITPVVMKVFLWWMEK